MKATRIVFGLVMAVVALALAAPVQAELVDIIDVVSPSLEFNTNGVFPSSRSDTSYSGTGAEGTIFDVQAGGVLHQKNHDPQQIGGNYITTYANPIQSDEPLTVEVRLNVMSHFSQGSGSQGTFFRVGDGSWEVGFGIRSDNPALALELNGNVTTTVGTGFSLNEFHVLRFEIDGDGGVFDFYLDDVLKFNGLALKNGTSNNVAFGDGASRKSGDVDWDYIRVFHLPEPATFGLMAIGGLMMLRRRRA